MYIQNVPYSKLLKLELPRLANRVIEIVEKHDPETLKIKEVFDLLVEEKPQVEGLIVRHGPHPITEELQPLRKKLLMYASTITFQMNVIVREDMYVKAENVRIAKIFINRYLLKLGLKKNREVIFQRLDEFFLEIEQDAQLEAILDTLGLTDSIDELQSVHSTVKELISKRLESISERPKVKTEELAKSVRKALKDMFIQIQIAQLKNKELNYSPLINELNDLLDTYRGLINARATLNKKRAEERKNNETGDSDTTQEAPETTVYVEPAGEMMHLSNVGDVSMNGHNVPLEETQKTVATSAKNNATTHL